jgi:hypothetical protein
MPQDKKRTFTIQSSEIGFAGGNYKSDAPGKAAKKAAKRIFNLIETVPEYHKFASHGIIKFFLREKTQGSDKKVYVYETSVEKLKTPKVVMVKSPNSPSADENGMVKYTVSKEIKVSTCTPPLP